MNTLRYGQWFIPKCILFYSVLWLVEVNVLRASVVMGRNRREYMLNGDTLDGILGWEAQG